MTDGRATDARATRESPAATSRRRAGTVAALGVAQTLAWASSYYLPAMLAVPMARDLGIPSSGVYGAVSLAMALSAFVGPFSGRAIDRHGGRPILIGTNLVFALGLGLLAAAQGPATLVGAWLVIGVGMGSGLYEAAFASLVRLYGDQARPSITGITLVAGFASTVGWPLSALLETHFGWRGACVGWALLHLLVGVPLNGLLPRVDRSTPPPAHAPADGTRDAGAHDALPAAWTTTLLAFVFAVTWFTSTAMASHLPRLLQDAGASLTAAVAVGALVGPSQVVARLLEFGLLRRLHPLLSARLATLMHPIGAALLLAAGPAMAAPFAVLHGGGNGILTIAKGTLPLVLFGPLGYGARQGLLMMPARIAQAMAPVLFGLAIERWHADALWLSGTLGLAAFAALLLLRARR